MPPGNVVGVDDTMRKPRALGEDQHRVPGHIARQQVHQHRRGLPPRMHVLVARIVKTTVLFIFIFASIYFAFDFICQL